MKLKGMLKISTSLMMVCAGFVMSSHAQAESYVTTSQINAANGVAGLNANKEVTANVTNSQVKVEQQYIATNGSTINRPLIKLVPDNQSGFTLGKEMVQFGGNYDTNGKIVPMGLSVYGRPYGNYNAGCTLCVFSSTGGMNGGSGQAAISGIDYRGGANAVANGDMATVGFYHFDEISSGRVVAQASSFGAGVVTLSAPMTNEQMSQLHVGMYVATNVIDPTLPVNASFLQSNAYWGYIKSWDATHIYVYDWAVLGKGNSTSGQIPNIQNLDNQLSTYTVPMVFVGVSGKIFAENEYMDADGGKVLGSNATAVVNAFEREEFDFRAHDWTKPNSLSFHGWTTSFQCRPNCNSKAVSEDSYAYLVNGPDGLPRAYVAQTLGNALEYSGYSTFIGGNGAPQALDNNGNIISAVVGSNHIMSSFASALPSNNTIHMSTIVNREAVGANDWRDYGVRLVMDVDSQRDRKKGLYNGSRMGSIAFNYNGIHYGGICLLGYDSNQGLCQEGDGSVNFAKNITAQSSVLINSGSLLRFASDNNTNAVYLYTKYNYTDDDKSKGVADTRGDLYIGTQVAGGANIRGVNGYYGRTLTVSQSVISPKFVGTLSTPSSSSASCTAGEFKDDANYHYVCVSANKWKRVALSDF